MTSIIRPTSQQHTFSPSDYTFSWTETDRGTWYVFDEAAGKAQAMAERKALAKQLKAEGWTVKLSSLGLQLRSFGGIGSGLPHIELWEPCYMLDAWKSEVR